MPHTGATPKFLRFEHQLELEIDRERRVGNADFLPVRDQLAEPLRKVRSRLLLQRRRRLEVQRRALGPERGLLELGLRPLAQALDELQQRVVRVHRDCLGEVAADGAVGLLLVLERVGVDGVVARVHHVVGQVGVAGGRELEGLVAAGGGDDGVRGRDGGDDVLDHALRQLVGDAGDAEFLGAVERLVVEPGDVLWVIGVEDDAFAVLFPRDDLGPFDAVFRLAGDGREGAEWYGRSRRMHVELAFDTGGQSREDDTCLPLETFGASVHQRLQRFWVVHVDHADESGVDPAPRLDAVESADDDLELHVEILVLVLDLAVERGDLDIFASFHHAGCSHLGFRFTNVVFSEEELTVQVGDVNGVHVDDMYVLES